MDKNYDENEIPGNGNDASGFDGEEYGDVSSSSEQSQSKHIGKWITVAITSIVILLVLVLSAFYLFRGDSDEGSKPEAYVDQSGQQEHEFEAAPGEPRGFNQMSINIRDEATAVDPVQATDKGVLLPPNDVSRVGWYSSSAVPGEHGKVGSSVITGHINHQSQGAGYAGKFAELELGEEFVVSLDDQDRRFRVTDAPYRLTKGEELPEVINDTAGENRLVLVTCGGQFVGGALGYEDNIITVAEPVL